MRRFQYIAILIATLLPAAHAMRMQGPGAAAAWLAFPPLFLVRRQWARLVYELALVCAAVMYAGTTLDLVRFRLAAGLPYLRLAGIMGGATLAIGLAGLLMESDAMRRRFAAGAAAWPGLAAFALTVAGLVPVQLKARPAMLLLERFLPGGGWLEIVLMGFYAAWITELMLDPKRSPVIRRRIWSLFSLVFFGQLALGLLGLDRFLMTGALHLPVPALILAGPIVRGGGMFMLILFGATLLVAGPAWCSHLCYIGAWDNAMCMAGKGRSASLPAWRHAARLSILLLVVAAAVALRLLGAPMPLSVILAAGFGLAGVGVMLLFSRRLGVMAHCAVFCPLGTVASYLGKLSPWRIRIDEGCTGCGTCQAACRYGALDRADIARKRPGIGCTLCGDCVGTCPRSEIGYSFLGRKTPLARTAFIVLVVGLHAMFLAVARI